MDDLEKQLSEKATYSTERVENVDVAEILDKYELTPIGMGVMGRVFRIEGTDWVVKEGRWDLDVELVGSLRMTLPANRVEEALKLFSYTFLPREEEILRQYKFYMKFAKYFGYFRTENDYYHPELERIIDEQNAFRQRLGDHVADLDIKLSSKIIRLLSDDVIYHNFLPKEYLLMGKSRSAENKGRDTYYIFQKFIEGTVLREVNVNQTEEIKKQFILLLILILIMKTQEGLIPDTRPKYPIIEALDWITKTDNIILADTGLKFVDTRWFWETNSNIVRRGLILPEMINNLAVNNINNLLSEL